MVTSAVRSTDNSRYLHGVFYSTALHGSDDSPIWTVTRRLHGLSQGLVPRTLPDLARFPPVETRFWELGPPVKSSQSTPLPPPRCSQLFEAPAAQTKPCCRPAIPSDMDLPQRQNTNLRAVTPRRSNVLNCSVQVLGGMLSAWPRCQGVPRWQVTTQALRPKAAAGWWRAATAPDLSNYCGIALRVYSL